MWGGQAGFWSLVTGQPASCDDEMIWVNPEQSQTETRCILEFLCLFWSAKVVSWSKLVNQQQTMQVPARDKEVRFVSGDPAETQLQRYNTLL